MIKTKHARLIGACLASALALTVLLVLTQTPKYTATSLVMIKPRAPQVFDLKEMMNEPSSDKDTDFYKTQYDILRSRSLAAQVIRSLNLEDDAYFNGKGVRPGFIAGIVAGAMQWLRGLLDGCVPVASSRQFARASDAAQAGGPRDDV